jgi:hypothetical protein
LFAFFAAKITKQSTQHAETLVVQHFDQLDQRQADQYVRVVAFEAFEQRDAEALGLEAAGPLVLPPHRAHRGRSPCRVCPGASNFAAWYPSASQVLP